jgi:hypothetical protein
LAALFEGCALPKKGEGCSGGVSDKLSAMVTFNPRFREKVVVTVCIAALCRWNYRSASEPEDWGFVAIAASDRMITSGDVQYEPNQTKVAQMTQRTMLLIAGDYSLHSEAIRATQRQLESNRDASPVMWRWFMGARYRPLKEGTQKISI